MTDARQIAVVTASNGYDGLHSAFRKRAEELNIRREDVDMLGGLTDGHAAKILAAYPIKAIGRTTLGPVLHALKLKLLVVPDDDVIWQEEPLGRRIKRRAMLTNDEHGIANMQERRAITSQVFRNVLGKHAKRASKKAAKARMQKISPAKRSRIAKHAARVRWHKPKLIELTKAEAANVLKAEAQRQQKAAPNGNKSEGALTSAQRIAPSRARSTRHEQTR